MMGPLLAENQCCIESCWYKRFEVGADWLYWEAQQSQMELATKVTTSGTLTNSSPVFPDFQYTSGYRVNIGYHLNACWTLRAALTHLPSSASTSSVAGPQPDNSISLNSTLYPIYTIFTQGGTTFSSLDLNWSLDTYYLDAYVNYAFCPCRLISLEPYLGLRGFWMKQKLEASGFSVADGATFTSSAKEKFNGGGLIGGFKGSCELDWGFSLIGRFGASLVYSKIDTDIEMQSPPANIQINGSDLFYKSHPTVDSFIGIQYSANCSCFSCEAHIGWENHIFFHTNQFTLTANGNLTLQGLTLGGSVCF